MSIGTRGTRRYARASAAALGRVRHAANARANADEFSSRLKNRLDELTKERTLAPQRPVIASAALVLPAGLANLPAASEDGVPGSYAVDQAAREVTDKAAVAAVLAAERSLGRKPTEMPHNHPGYDIESLDTDGHLLFIEVKGRQVGATGFHVTKNEIITGLNKQGRYILALVEVDGTESRAVRYLRDPYSGDEHHYTSMASVEYLWNDHWNRGSEPA